MMLWCELHNSSGVKGGITNFDPAEYEKDLSWLQVVNQVALTQTAQTAPVHTTTCLDGVLSPTDHVKKQPLADVW